MPRLTPAIILIEPQLPENIGSVARAMLNFGLSDLRLVRPQPRWPHPQAKALASGADEILDHARIESRTEDAVGDLHRLYATTARRRDMLKPVVTLRQGVAELTAAALRGERVGVLFGAERMGLQNEDIVRAEKIVTVPLNPEFSSLNLAQAVALFSYEWFIADDITPQEKFDLGRTRLANRAELEGLFDQLERELTEAGYFEKIPDKQEALMSNIKNSLQRGPLLEQDVRTLRGIIKQLAGRRVIGSKKNKVKNHG